MAWLVTKGTPRDTSQRYIYIYIYIYIVHSLDMLQIILYCCGAD
jgi:hypothetical protein